MKNKSVSKHTHIAGSKGINIVFTEKQCLILRDLIEGEMSALLRNNYPSCLGKKLESIDNAIFKALIKDIN